MAKNKNIEDLLHRLGNENSEAAENAMQDLYTDAPRTFGEGFADRVMAGATGEVSEKGMDYFLPRLFKWVAATGVAAAIALLMMTYIAEDTISMDAMAGVGDVGVADVIALNE